MPSNGRMDSPFRNLVDREYHPGRRSSQLSRLRDVRALVMTPVGRTRLRLALVRRAWPVLAPPAALYRRTVARRTRLVAVTGTFGKTTTTRTVMAALGLSGPPSRNYGGFV